MAIVDFVQSADLFVNAFYNKDVGESPRPPSFTGDAALIHIEQHRTDRIDWLRAAVLGANDGIVSTASLVVGVAAAETSRTSILLAGVA